MIEALGADGTHESLRVRVCTRRAHRGANGLDADGGENLVEAGGELGVPVADEEPEASTGLFEIGGEVAGDLGHPWVIGIGGGTEDVDDASLQFDHEQHVVTTEERNWLGPLTTPSTTCGFDARIVGNSGQRS